MPLSLLLLAAATSSLADPLAPARVGQIQCYEPDDAHKTCRSTAAYRPTGGQAYLNTALVLLSPDSAVTLETATPVVVKNGAVCGTLTPEIVAQGKLRVGARLVDGDHSKAVLEKITQAMSRAIGKEICTTYKPAASDLVATATLDGKPMTGTHQRVRWIKPADGYVVASATAPAVSAPGEMP